MRDEEILILEICKRKGNNSTITRLLKNNTIDWQYFLETISKHKIAPLVLEKLLEFPLLQSQKKLFNNRHKEEILKTMLNSKILRTEMTRIIDILQRSNIECILLKGLSLDFSHLRTIGDLDILIRQENLLNAFNLLGQIDYVYIGNIINHHLISKEKNHFDLQLSWNNQFQLYYERTGLLLELHTNLFERSRVYVEDLDTLLDNIDLFWKEKRYDKNLNCFTLSRNHSLLLMCLHNALKRSPSKNTFILRTILDIDNLIEMGVEWDNLIETSLKLDIGPFVYFSLLMTQKLFDRKIPEDVLTALKNNWTIWQLFLTNVHLKCFNSLYTSSILYSNMYNFLCPFVFGRRWKDRIMWIFLIPVLFPPRWKMAQHFNLKMDSPFIYFTYLLNPFRWIYIILRNVFRK